MDLSGGRVLVVAVAPALDRYVWIDGLEIGAVNRPRRATWQAGGKALNVARVLRQLGTSVTAVVPTPVTDLDRVRGGLAAAGIDAELVLVAGELRQTLTIVDDVNGATTELYEPSPGLGDDEWAALAAAATAATATMTATGEAGAVIVSGTRPGGDAMSAALTAISDAAERAAVPLYVDGRPPTVAGLLVRARSRELIVKVNAAEATELLGADGPPGSGAVCLGALARAIVGRGAHAAVVTAGTDGAAFAGGAAGDAAADLITVAGPRRSGRSPGGSGDAFLAGLVAGRLGGLGVVDTLDLARRCAEANAQQPLAGDLGGVGLLDG